MGFLAGVANALVTSFQNSFFKKLPGISPAVLNWFRFVVASIVLGVLATIFGAWRLPAEPRFWLILFFVSLPLELFQSYFYVKAFQRSPQSLVGPLFALSALFVLPMSYALNGEMPSAVGFLGVVSVAAGPFVLAGKRGSGFAGSLKALAGDSGAWRMVVSSLFAAAAVTVSKFQLRDVPALLWAFYITAALAFALSVFLIFRRASPRAAFNRTTLGMSATYGIGMALHYVGLSLLLAAYFVSLKRLSIVFDVFFGKFMHREERFRERLVGALLMVAGVVLIALG